VQTLNSVDELLQYPVGTERRALEVLQINAIQAQVELLQCEIGAHWTWLRAMRVLRSTQVPISWLDAYVVPRFADVLDLDNPTGAPMLRQIEEHHGHHAAQSQVAIMAGPITAEQATPLSVEIGSP